MTRTLLRLTEIFIFGTARLGITRVKLLAQLETQVLLDQQARLELTGLTELTGLMGQLVPQDQQEKLDLRAQQVKLEPLVRLENLV
jgi:hypothetical protein